LDVLLSPNGKIGTAVSGAQTVPFFFSADDLLWSTGAPLPRLGQGAFREMITAVFESVTGEALHVTQYGKPRRIAFAYAEKKLKDLSAELYGYDPRLMDTIFMVGDNVETDIVGANAAGRPWTSVLVMSGVGLCPSATRSVADEEGLWQRQYVDSNPHYVAPTLDHFVRELLAFPKEALTMNCTRAFNGPPCPVDLHAGYNFHPVTGSRR
jgi:ribonucleotide monophosphatase NagD (HAD superfamily)